MDILSTREWALVIWISVIVCTLLVSPKFKSIRESLQDVVKIFLSKEILQITVPMTLYVIACLYSLSHVGLWDWYQLKVTIVWYLAIALSVLYRYKEIKQNPRFCINLVVDNFKLIGIIEFVVDKYTFNIFVELILTPALFLIVAMLAIAQTKKDHKHKHLERILNGILIAIGSLIVIITIYMLVSDISKLANKETLRDFYIPPLLTLSYLPFIFLIVLHLTYKSEFGKLHIFIKDKWLRFYAKMLAIFLFHLRISLLEKWVSNLAFQRPVSITEINKSFQIIFRTVSAESNPQNIDPSLGWSPYIAKDFLSAVGIATGHYHPVGLNDWQSSSKMVELDEAIIPNNISYYVTGEEKIAKSLKLILYVNIPDDPIPAHEMLLLAATLLFSKAINMKLPYEIESAIKRGIDYSFKIGNYSVSVEKHSWPCHRRGGYDIQFAIVHSVYS